MATSEARKETMSKDFKFGLKFVIGLAVAAFIVRVFIIDRGSGGS